MTKKPQTRANCTVGLLAMASQTAYRVKKDNILDPLYSAEYSQGLIDMAEHGYAITDSIVPIGSKGTGKTPLGAVCLTPQDPEAPIVIAFRGTKTGGDVLSDIRLGTVGTVNKVFRDSAFAFYKKIREENPGREIVLTGHSLGGHLAQYVATKAYNTVPSLLANPLVQVRTFNTAPLDTTHSSVFKSHPHLLSQYVNYRLSSDVVSDLPLQRYWGNTFVFPCDQGFMGSHAMAPIVKYIPQEILKQTVGTSSESKKQNLLIELVNGTMHSYQCRVEGQFFSRFRAGAKNLAAMQSELPEVLEYIKKGKYDEAVLKLDELKGKLDGNTSKGTIDVLIKSTINVKLNQKMETANATPQADSRAQQELLKSQLHELRESHPPVEEEIAEREDPHVG